MRYMGLTKMNHYAKLNVTLMKIVSSFSLILKAGVYYTNHVVEEELPDMRDRLTRNLKMSAHVIFFILHTIYQNDFNIS